MKLKIFRLLEVALVLIGFSLVGLATYQYGKLKFNKYIQEVSSQFNTNITADPPSLDKDILYLPITTKVMKLDETRIVQLIGEVDSEVSKQVILDIAKLNEKSNEPITLLIDSPGGSVIDGAQIVGAIQSSKAKINTVCVTLCASMAAMIHQYGAERQVFAHSILMFHPAFGGALDDVDRMYSQIKTIQRYTAKMEENVALRVGITFEEYKNRAGRQIWLDGEDAVTEHFADSVVFYKGNSIQSVFKKSKEAEDKTKEKKVKQKFNVFVKSGFDFLSNYFFPETNTAEQLRNNFRNE